MEQKDEKIVFRIDPDPTFWAPVEFSIAGGKVGKIRVEFVYKDRDEYREFFKEHKDCKDSEALPLLIKGWEGPDADYSAETLARILTNYPASGLALINAYRDNIFGVAEKN